MTAFAAQLRRLRKEKGMTQEQLANLLYVTRQTISNWENDKAQPDYDMLSEIAAVFEVSLSSLLGEEEKPAPAPPEAAVVTAQTPTETPTEQGEDHAEDPTAAQSDAPAQPVLQSPAPATDQTAVRSMPAARPALLFALALLLMLGVSAAARIAFRAQAADQPFSMEQFTAAAQQTPGKAYLNIYTRENSARYIQARPEADPRWSVRFFMQETSGMGLDVNMLTTVLFYEDGTQSVGAETKREFKVSLGHPHIAPGEMRIFTWSAGADPNAVGVGLEVQATDENGSKLVFTAYQPLEYIRR